MKAKDKFGGAKPLLTPVKAHQPKRMEMNCRPTCHILLREQALKVRLVLSAVARAYQREALQPTEITKSV